MDETEFAELGKHAVLIFRGMYGGPTDSLDRLFLPTMRRLRLHPRLRRHVIRRAHEYPGRPFVGVHVRRGDFRTSSQDVYDHSAGRNQTIPFWWYEHVMEELQRGLDAPVFYLSHNGLTAQEVGSLKARFTVITGTETGTFGHDGDGHCSEVNPVEDLFSLACCPIIIGTPRSTFTHVPAHGLGAPSKVIVPPSKTRRDDPRYLVGSFWGRRVPFWIDREFYTREDLAQDAIPELDYLVNVDWL